MDVKAAIEAIGRITDADVQAFLGGVLTQQPPDGPITQDPQLRDLMVRALKSPDVASLIHGAMRDEIARMGQERLDELKREREEIHALLVNGDFAESGQ